MRKAYDGEHSLTAVHTNTDANAYSAVCLGYMIDLLFDIDIGSHDPSCAGFNAVPLPSTRDLWAASTHAAWENLYKSQMQRSHNAILTFGDLRTSQQLNTNMVDTQISDRLVSWCKNVDRFGSVIMMAAGLSS